MSETVVDSVDILDRPRPSSRVIAFGKAVIGILWSSVPGDNNRQGDWPLSNDSWLIGTSVPRPDCSCG